ncbi:hypothetical protein EDD16DRAFT_1515099 [Pisolithus croceorrhizus]|nr:hypothetical protein EDD16DRAFT_1515099 [Pisolithus croceorrhizus]
MSSDVVLRGDRQSDVLISPRISFLLFSYFSKPPQLSANVWYNGTWTVELKSCSQKLRKERRDWMGIRIIIVRVQKLKEQRLRDFYIAIREMVGDGRRYSDMSSYAG